jgi:hypothetical protein
MSLKMEIEILSTARYISYAQLETNWFTLSGNQEL